LIFAWNEFQKNLLTSIVNVKNSNKSQNENIKEKNQLEINETKRKNNLRYSKELQDQRDKLLINVRPRN
jgi:hypothetical protein